MTSPIKPLTRAATRKDIMAFWPKGPIQRRESVLALLDRAEDADREVGRQMGLRQLAEGALNGVMETLATAEQERDEARAQVGRLRAALVVMEEWLCSTTGCICDCPVIDGHTSSCLLIAALDETKGEPK